MAPRAKKSKNIYLNLNDTFFVEKRGKISPNEYSLFLIYLLKIIKSR